MPFDIPTIINAIGLLGVFAIIFAETGLFIGFFLPGDSLLFTAGLLASQGLLNLPLLLVGSFVAAVIGDSVGYTFGRHIGPRLFKREDSFLFRRQHIERTRVFYKRHGAKTILVARFVPIVRTFAPILAGVGNMPYKTFLTYNIVGGFLWAVGVPLAGYWLGSAIPGVDRYLIPIIIIIIFISLIPAGLEWLKSRRPAQDLPESDKTL